jgi:hypothetical protein
MTFGCLRLPKKKARTERLAPSLVQRTKLLLAPAVAGSTAVG